MKFVQKKSWNKKAQNAIVFSFFSILFVLFSVMAYTYAASKNTTLTVQLSDKVNSAFPDTVLTLEIDKNQQVKLPTTFSSMVNVTVPSANQVDEETFYFSDDWKTNAEVFAYSFTGWKVSGAAKLIPGSTVFQPGDTIDLNEVTANPLNLEAVWGRVIFIKNPYNTMVYNKYALLDEASSAASGTTGASDSNDGRTTSTPVATLNYAYTQFAVDSVNRDPYKNVLMLVGDLDYIKSNSTCTSQSGFDKGYQSNFWGYGVAGKNTTTEATNQARHVTIKSLLTAGKNYLLKIKPYNYNANFYGSTRFDNVDM